MNTREFRQRIREIIARKYRVAAEHADVAAEQDARKPPMSEMPKPKAKRKAASR